MQVGIIDSGIDQYHPDLASNVDETKNLNMAASGTDPFHPVSSHGQAVAGVVGAKGDAKGIRGVAPDATLYGVNVLAVRETASNAERAVLHELTNQDVSNHSYGPADDGRLHRAPSLWNRAVDRLVKEGSGGLGASYVVAAGNGGSSRRGEYYDFTSLDEHNSHMGVIPVCAVSERGQYIFEVSEPGPNLWVCGPSRDFYGIFTTSLWGRYRDDFGGTSAAAPSVSGVIALLRDAEPSLTWRDVRLILAESATKLDSSHAGWVEGASTYSGSGNYNYNEFYGFGLVNAKAAVDLAVSWTPPSELLMDTGCESPNLDVPRDNTRFTVRTIELDSTDLTFVEHVEIHVDLTTTRLVGTEVWISSPSNSVEEPGAGEPGWSLLVPFRQNSDLGDLRADGRVRYSASQFLGQPAKGEWKLAIRNRGTEDDTVKLHSWELVVYGHGTGAGTTNAVEVLDSDRSLACGRPRPPPPPPPPPPSVSALSLSSISDQVFRVGQTVDMSLPTASGGEAPYSYELTPIDGLPIGINYDADTRRLTGVARSVAVEHEFTWSVTDQQANEDDLTFTIEVREEDGGTRPVDPNSSCDRHVAPFWQGTGGFAVRPLPGRRYADVEIQCGENRLDERLYLNDDQNVIVQSLGKSDCMDADGSPVHGFVAFEGIQDGGWYWVNGPRNAAVAPLVCEEMLGGPDATVPGGVEIKWSARGTFISHETGRMIAIIPHIVRAPEEGPHIGPYWRGKGGLVGEAADGVSIKYRVTCGDREDGGVLRADDGGVIAELLRPSGCTDDDGVPLEGTLEVYGMKDGGWYWVDGTRNAAASALLRRSVLQGPPPVDSGGVDMLEGQYGTLFLHHTQGLIGIVPRIRMDEETRGGRGFQGRAVVPE